MTLSNAEVSKFFNVRCTVRSDTEQRSAIFFTRGQQ
jgi:hypothetical protein